MKFYNHCTEELFNEAKRVISKTEWHPYYKEQVLLRVEYMLEAGNMIHKKTSSRTEPFTISDVEGIVTIVSDRDD